MPFVNVVKTSAILLSFSALCYASGTPAQHRRSFIDLSSLAKRQEVPTLGESCSNPGSSPFDVVCDVEVTEDGVLTRCSETCCYFGGAYIGGCAEGHSCMIASNGVLEGCCEGPDPDACGAPSPCVNADEEPVGGATPCPSATPICFTSQGVPGCSGSFTDIFTRTSTSTSTSTSTTSSDITSTSTSTSTSETPETTTATESTITYTSSSTSSSEYEVPTTLTYTSATYTESTGTVPVPTANGTFTVRPPPEATGAAAAVGKTASAVAAGFLASLFAGIAMFQL